MTPCGIALPFLSIFYRIKPPVTRWLLPTMFASFVRMVIVKDFSHVGCTAVFPLVYCGTVTAGRSAAKARA